jgi:ABC-2 type transport system ATP-binding protein
MIARALLHEPKVLFLDEPTVGLDPQVRRRLWELVRELSVKGMTVLLTTHYIEEAEYLCHRTAILDKGKLIALDTPRSLCASLGEYVVEWQAEGGTKTRFFPEKQSASLFLSSLSAAALVRQTNLEDFFVEQTGRKVKE